MRLLGVGRCTGGSLGERQKCGIGSKVSDFTDLKYSRLDACVLEEVHEERAVEVGHAEVTDEPFIDELF